MSDVDIAKMKVADLKKELKNKGLSVTGNKTELMERYQSALLDGTDSILEDSAISEELDEDVLDDDDDLYEETKTLLNSPTHDDIDTDFSSPIAEKSLPDDDELETTPIVKKVILKRTISAVKEPTKQLESITSTDDVSSTEPDKKIIKLVELTIEERRELRAKKFGGETVVTTSEKKDERAKRFGIETITTTTATDEKKNSKISDNGVSTSVDILKKRAERFGGSVSSTITKIELGEKLQKRQERFGSTPAQTTVTTDGVIIKKTPITTIAQDKEASAAILTGDYAEKARLRLERFKTDVK